MELILSQPTHETGSDSFENRFFFQIILLLLFAFENLLVYLIGLLVHQKLSIFELTMEYFQLKLNKPAGIRVKP